MCLVAKETKFIIFVSMETRINMDKESENLLLAPVIIGKLINIGAMLRRNTDKSLLPFELNQQQFSIFFEITKAGKVRQKDIVNRLLLEKAHVSKVIKKLHTMGLISFTFPDEDKRSFFLSPTIKGEDTLKECMKIFEKWNKKWLGAIDENQIPSILENLSKLQSVFKEEVNYKNE